VIERSAEETVREAAMKLEDRIRKAEERLFEAAGLDPDVAFLDVPRGGARIRVLTFGSGQPVLLLHGVATGAVVWTSLLGHLGGYRVHAVDLPGHGLSDPFDYRPGAVRSHTVQMIDGLYDELALESAPLVGHSLGGMFALWHAAARPGRIASLVVFGDPAVAIPGAAVRMPLSPMTVPVLGPAMFRSPSSRGAYRRLFTWGNGGAPDASAELLDALRLSGRRAGNARTVGALMHAINRFRRPRPESVMSAEELGRIRAPTLFVWGTGDRYLSPDDARPWIDKMPAATLHEVTAGHAPFLEDPAGSAAAVLRHLETSAPRSGAARHRAGT
jgi:pimeloyl-ACP methyl ester carboxylesterase